MKSGNIDADDFINRKFIEISNRQTSYNHMTTDEKLAEICNSIEHMLKKES